MAVSRQRIFVRSLIVWVFHPLPGHSSTDGAIACDFWSRKYSDWTRVGACDLWGCLYDAVFQKFLRVCPHGVGQGSAARRSEFLSDFSTYLPADLSTDFYGNHHLAIHPNLE